MITFDNIYKFYDLPEEDRAKLVGQKIQQVESFKFKRKLKSVRIFYVVDLDNEWTNYGSKQGLIGLLQPLVMRLSQKELTKYIKGTGDPYWFKLYAFSPDDLDLALHFDAPKNTKEVFNRVEKFMDEHCSLFFNMSYKEILKFAQKELGMGEIGM